MNSTPINRKLVEQSISKSAKKVIAESGMNPSTRSGSKELEHLVKRLAEQPFNNLTAAIQAGEELGRKIVELSQQIGKQNLDQGVIRQLMLKKQFPSASLSQATAQSAPKSAHLKAQPTPVEEPTVPSAQLEPTTESETAAQAETTPSNVSPAAKPAVASPAIEDVEEPIEASGDVSVYETVDEATDDDNSSEERTTDDLTDESEAESLITDATLDSEDTKAEVGAIDDTEASDEQIDQLNQRNASTELSITTQTDAEDHPEVDDAVSPADTADTSAQALSIAPIAAENLDEVEETEAIAEDAEDLEANEPAEIESNDAVDAIADADVGDDETIAAAKTVSVSDDELNDELNDEDDTDEDNKTIPAEKPAQPKGDTTPPIKVKK